MRGDNIWASASFNGLILASVTIVVSLIQSLLLPGTAVGMIMWLVKLVGSLWVLYFFMKKYAVENGVSSYGRNFRYGVLVCLFSSVLCAGYAFISAVFLFPEQTDLVMETVTQSVAAGNFTSEQENAIEDVMNNFPKIMLFSAAFLYIIEGIVASSILANYTKVESTPFSNNNLQ